MKKRIVILSVLSVLVGAQAFSDMQVRQPEGPGEHTIVPGQRRTLPRCEISGKPLTVVIDGHRIGTLDDDPAFSDRRQNGSWNFFPNSEHTVSEVKRRWKTAVSAQKELTDLVDLVIPIDEPGRQGHQCTVTAQGPILPLRVRINGTEVGTYSEGRFTFTRPNTHPER